LAPELLRKGQGIQEAADDEVVKWLLIGRNDIKGIVAVRTAIPGPTDSESSKRIVRTFL
jgi:hypothetical protein